MPGSYTHLLVHVVFSTHLRTPWLAREMRPRLFGYIQGICRNIKAPLVVAGGIEDHVHLLIDLHPSVALADAVRGIKANSSRWLHDTFSVDAFAWQAGYAAFTVSWSGRDEVRRYIEDQEHHHRTRGFVDEFRELLEKHDMVFDEAALA